MKNKKKTKTFEKVKYCRICGYTPLKTFLELGPLPTPNGYLEKSQLKEKEPKYPLTIGRCINCGLVQLTEVVDPAIMFRNYKYVPSASQTMVEHFEELAEYIFVTYKLKKKSFVIDIGSNDGTLLKSFKKRTAKVLGVDPAENLAQIASNQGIETLSEFFNLSVAKMIRKKYGKADVVTGTNVVAHVSNLHSLFSGVKALLKKNGIFIMEFPYLLDLLDHTEFDTIYQEHLSYFSVKPLGYLATKHGFFIDDIQKMNVHGGSIRVVMKKGKKSRLTKPTLGFLALEDSRNLYSSKIYDDFSKRISIKKLQLMKLLNRIKKDRFKIIGLGASARGNILMNYFGIDNKILDYIVDSTPYKHGLYTPGHHIPILPESHILKDQPDYILLLAWNFKDEILKKQQEYRKRGGKFILIVPEVEII